jgi:hypothetical protein
MVSTPKLNGREGQIRAQKNVVYSLFRGIKPHQPTLTHGKAEKPRNLAGRMKMRESYEVLGAAEIEKQNSIAGSYGAAWLENAIAVSQEHIVEGKYTVR